MPNLRFTLRESCNNFRADCKSVENDVRKLAQRPEFEGVERFPGQHKEMRRHVDLAVRHLEDARMRLGKVIQYSEDGVSVLDKIPADVLQEADRCEQRGPVAYEAEGFLCSQAPSI